jgi:hypothetical protein
LIYVAVWLAGRNWVIFIVTKIVITNPGGDHKVMDIMGRLAESEKSENSFCGSPLKKAWGYCAR